MVTSVILNIILCILMIILIISSLIYVYIDEHKKTQYYKSKLFYITNWDKYSTMVEKQKRIIFYKKIELLVLLILVKIKRVFVWK